MDAESNFGTALDSESTGGQAYAQGKMDTRQSHQPGNSNPFNDVQEIRRQFEVLTVKLSEAKKRDKSDSNAELQKLDAEMLQYFVKTSATDPQSGGRNKMELTTSENSEVSSSGNTSSVKPKTKGHFTEPPRGDARDSTESDEVSTRASTKKYKKKKRKTTSEDVAGGIDKLSIALARLDSRKVPPPDCYKLSSGQPFGKFLENFEIYAEGTYKGSMDQWSIILDDFLSGTISEAYKALYFPGESYHSLKGKMVA